MKKALILLCTLLVFVLTGCGGEKLPSTEEIIKLLEENSETYGIINVKDAYTPEVGIIEEDNRYIELISFYVLSEDEQRENIDADSYNFYLYVFNNDYDALLSKKINEIKDDYFEKQYKKEGFSTYDDIFSRQIVYVNQNIVLQTTSDNQKQLDDITKVLDDYIGEKKFKQINRYSEDRYNELVDYYQNDEHLKKYEDNFKETLDDNITYINNLFDFYYSYITETELSLENIDYFKNSIERYSSINVFKPYVDKWNEYIVNVDEMYYLESTEKDNTITMLNSRVEAVKGSLNTSEYDSLVSEVSELSTTKAYCISLYRTDLDRLKSELDSISTKIAAKRREEAINEYKNSCIKISYNEFFRNSSEYIGTKVHFKGEVVQVIDQNSLGALLRVNVTRQGSYITYYTDTIYVYYDSSNEIESKKILEDDIIDLYGEGAGDYTYKSVLGASITIPKVNAYYIDIR